MNKHRYNPTLLLTREDIIRVEREITTSPNGETINNYHIHLLKIPDQLMRLGKKTYQGTVMTYQGKDPKTKQEIISDEPTGEILTLGFKADLGDLVEEVIDGNNITINISLEVYRKLDMTHRRTQRFHPEGKPHYFSFRNREILHNPMDDLE